MSVCLTMYEKLCGWKVMDLLPDSAWGSLTITRVSVESSVSKTRYISRFKCLLISCFKNTIWPLLAFATLLGSLTLALECAFAILPSFLFFILSWAMTSSSRFRLFCENWSLENNISRAVKPWCRTFSLTTEVAFVKIFKSTIPFDDNFLISSPSSFIFLSARAKAFLFFAFPNSREIFKSDKEDFCLKRDLKPGAWSTLMVVVKDDLNGVVVSKIPSNKSSDFSDLTKAVLTKPEKFSTVTIIFFLLIFRISTENEFPGCCGISLGLKVSISRGIFEMEQQRVHDLVISLTLESLSRMKNFVSRILESW